MSRTEGRLAKTGRSERGRKNARTASISGGRPGGKKRIFAKGNRYGKAERGERNADRREDRAFVASMNLVGGGPAHITLPKASKDGKRVLRISR